MIEQTFDDKVETMINTLMAMEAVGDVEQYIKVSDRYIDLLVQIIEKLFDIANVNLIPHDDIRSARLLTIIKSMV